MANRAWFPVFGTQTVGRLLLQSIFCVDVPSAQPLWTVLDMFRELLIVIVTGGRVMPASGVTSLNRAVLHVPHFRGKTGVLI